MKSNYRNEIIGANVVVTGGLGFVGHNLVKKLIDEYNCKVTVIDDCSNSSPEILGEYISKIKFYKLSVLEISQIIPIIKECNYFFHLACVQISASSKDPLKDLQVNAQSTMQILEYLKENILELNNFKRFIYTSSCSVYGSSAKQPLSETDPTNVLSFYAATKLLGENYTMIYNRTFDIPTSVVRYSNVYGYGQSSKNPYCGVLGKFIDLALKGERLSIFGDGEQTRDYTFIDDAVDATILAAVHPKALGDVFNVGTGIETSVNELVLLLKEVTNLNIEVQNLPERDIDNIRRRSIDIEKIHQKLGWAPNYNLRKGLKLTFDSKI
jgi:UDP-glucose 4-epimerase